MCLKKKTDGVLIVDPYGDEAPLQLHLNIGIGELMNRRYIRLKVEQPKSVTFGWDSEQQSEDDNDSYKLNFTACIMES